MTNCHKVGSLKRHSSIISASVSQKSLSIAYLGFLLKVSASRNHTLKDSVPSSQHVVLKLVALLSLKGSCPYTICLAASGCVGLADAMVCNHCCLSLAINLPLRPRKYCARSHTVRPSLCRHIVVLADVL